MDSEFALISWRQLFSMTMNGVKAGSVFDIPDTLFYTPTKQNPLRTRMFGQPLENPTGISAGPHSQMAQNIISAWLCGARYIELKTVQTDDELDIPRPCIDMPYEGYNCEFSQELKIKQSYHEYLNAWILIHILKDYYNWTEDAGTIFNMSIGYDIKGIKQPNVQWFFDKMNDSSDEIMEKKNAIADLYPRVKDLHIPARISDNVTLSTMHGCPPEEIREIGEYLLSEKGLHTYIKFNPTLLGQEKIREILDNYQYKATVPDAAFEHDIGYSEAVEVITSLIETAKTENLNFGLKLTNTLEINNHKNVFEGEEMFMSGKALHPVSINVARRLKNEAALKDTPVSFSGGVDAFNIADTFACGFSPVTVSSDLLRPGGYGKLSQYIEELQQAIGKAEAESLPDYVMKTAGSDDFSEAARKNLNRYADKVLEHPQYKAQAPSIKLERPLHHFDCIQAPCQSTCPAAQNVPGYLYYASRGEYEKAFDVIMQDNPFPSVSGMICDHECQTHCTRVLYDNALLIREIKRYVAENHYNKLPAKTAARDRGKVAIIGAGPSGLSCAFFAARYGFAVDVFEEKAQAGGMVSATIPSFRLSQKALEADIQRIQQMGVTIHYNTRINRKKFREIQAKFDFIYLAVGAPQSKKLQAKGADEVKEGLISPLEFLAEIKKNHQPRIGKNIVVLGGGNVAMDVARTACRLADKDGSVKLLYRRTRQQMPAADEELEEALEEGITWHELVNPQKVVTQNGRVTSLKCQQMKLEGTDQSGRPRPVPDGDKQLLFHCDTIIPAFGQEIEPEFREFINEQGERTGFSENVFMGGDAKRGASTLIKAIADGKYTARKMLKQAGQKPEASDGKVPKQTTLHELQTKKARIQQGKHEKKRNPENRNDFELVNRPLNDTEVQEEASRCMFCDELCNICVDVCPNRANYFYSVSPFGLDIPVARRHNGITTFDTAGTFSISQQYQVLNIKDWCNECGNCETFCPSSGAPYRDKPRLHLTQKSFSEAETGFYYEAGILYWKKQGIMLTLQKAGNLWHYHSENAEAQFRTGDFQPEKVTLRNNTHEVQFQDAIAMSVIYKPAQQLNTEYTFFKAD